MNRITGIFGDFPPVFHVIAKLFTLSYLWNILGDFALNEASTNF
jgi:hypothetical protein